ncbi:glycosyltransferase [Geobacter pickeringii]|uniref:Glycosyltransferase 2-like domain-containing protein n=1 Tax=Geobacter pickeringii TaxID=345632 RepID=A0A0B5B9S8_9BACT|nr:glycosyltransferase [Geobacter pickeringii]AJE03473.1 hypothetical protein GPICK_09025 [Geobacter pickeringii]
MLITVIMPCYNRERYLALAINSVLCQTWPMVELIVVDDGCTDGSRSILESYGSRIRLLEHPGRVNRGQSAAINLGLRHATGEYIAILDSDDLFAPEKIEKQMRFLECHQDVGLVYSNGKAIDADGKELYFIYKRDHQPPSGPADVLENCCVNLPSNALVRRAVFERAGFFDEHLRTAQDHDMVIRITEVATVGYLDEVLWFYRRHDASISSTKALERWQNGFRILDAARRRYPYPARTLKRRLAVLNFRLGQCYLEQRAYFRAVYHFIRAGMLDPSRSARVIRGREAVSGPH